MYVLSIFSLTCLIIHSTSVSVCLLTSPSHPRITSVLLFSWVNISTSTHIVYYPCKSLITSYIVGDLSLVLFTSNPTQWVELIVLYRLHYVVHLLTQHTVYHYITFHELVDHYITIHELVDHYITIHELAKHKKHW